jgi:hypothetical protein
MSITGPRGFIRAVAPSGLPGTSDSSLMQPSANLITPASRRQAVALVREGVSYPMTAGAEFTTVVDNPTALIRKMPRRAAAPTLFNSGPHRAAGEPMHRPDTAALTSTTAWLNASSFICDGLLNREACGQTAARKRKSPVPSPTARS